MYQTIAKAQSVFFVLLFFVIFVSLEALVMLRYSWQEDAFADSRYSNFKNYQDASLVMYVYVALGENYADILGVVMEKSRYYFLFFGPIAIVGIVFLLALVAAVFESMYEKANRRNTRALYVEKMSALAASFGLWYVVHSIWIGVLTLLSRSGYCIRLIEQELEAGNLENLKAMALADDRVANDQVEKCTDIDEMNQLWQAAVISQSHNEPQLTLDNFKALAAVISEDDMEGEKVAIFAFELLDIDGNNTISFSEFEASVALSAACGFTIGVCRMSWGFIVQ